MKEDFRLEARMHYDRFCLRASPVTTTVSIGWTWPLADTEQPYGRNQRGIDGSKIALT